MERKLAIQNISFSEKNIEFIDFELELYMNLAYLCYIWP